MSAETVESVPAAAAAPDETDVSLMLQLPANRSLEESLSVAVQDPTGKDARLSFQWAHLHPATVIACSQYSNDPIVQLSRQFPAYRDAAAALRSESCRAENKKVHCHKPALLTASNVTIDLSELLPDPPLLSDCSVDAMFLDDSTDAAMNNTTHRAKFPANTTAMEMTAATLLERVLDKSMQLLASSSTASATIAFADESLSLELTGLCSEDALFDALPPSLIMERLTSIITTDNECSLTVALLIVLAEGAATETTGRYILQHLAPALLLLLDDPAQRLKDGIATADLRRLAQALIGSCGLKDAVSRQELLSLTLVDQAHDSDAYRELITCLAECYFDAE